MRPYRPSFEQLENRDVFSVCPLASFQSLCPEHDSIGGALGGVAYMRFASAGSTVLGGTKPQAAYPIGPQTAGLHDAVFQELGNKPENPIAVEPASDFIDNILFDRLVRVPDGGSIIIGGVKTVPLILK